jgi:predicted HNH restriction endonuclease
VNGIGGGVWGLREMDPLNPSNDDGVADAAEPFLAAEGAGVLKTHLRRERSRHLIDKFKAALSTCACTICGFNFALCYGEIGRGFIEAHHIVPVSELKPGSKSSVNDLVPVCSNCHRMLHRGNLSIAELRLRLSQRQPVQGRHATKD